MIGDDPKYRRRINIDAYVFAVLSLISFSVLLFSTRSFMEFKDVGLSMYSGLRGSIYGVTSFISRTVLSIQELANLKEEYTELTERMTRYEQLERTAADIRQENTRLREQLGFSQSLVYRHMAVEIIGYDPDNLFSAFVVNKGKKHGIDVNMPVVAYQNGNEILVGKVVQTGQFESLVMPLYDTASFVSSRLSESRFEGIVEGQGSPESPLLMRFVRRRTREEINIGEQVVTSGLGGVYPAGITLGRVNRIHYQDSDTSIEIDVESSADFSRLEYVFVIDSFSKEGGDTEPENPEQEENRTGVNG
jgi:rod shape-determining protein MreC